MFVDSQMGNSIPILGIDLCALRQLLGTCLVVLTLGLTCHCLTSILTMLILLTLELNTALVLLGGCQIRGH